MKTIAFALLASATAVAAQDPPAPRLDKSHEWLKQLEGEWDVEGKFFHDPERPIEIKGVETCRLELNGFWLFSTFKASLFGAPFEGRSTLGWSPFKKKFVGTWVDSMLPHLFVSEGDLDASGKVLSMSTEGVDLQTGALKKERWVTEILDKDTHTFTFYGAGPDGKERKTGEIRYARRK